MVILWIWDDGGDAECTGEISGNIQPWPYDHRKYPFSGNIQMGKYQEISGNIHFQESGCKTARRNQSMQVKHSHRNRPKLGFGGPDQLLWQRPCQMGGFQQQG